MRIYRYVWAKYYNILIPLQIQLSESRLFMYNKIFSNIFFLGKKTPYPLPLYFTQIMYKKIKWKNHGILIHHKCEVAATLMIYNFQEAKGHVFILKFALKSVMSYFAKLSCSIFNFNFVLPLILIFVIKDFLYIYLQFKVTKKYKLKSNNYSLRFKISFVYQKEHFTPTFFSHNNLCVFTELENKFCTQKPIINIRLKDIKNKSYSIKYEKFN